MSGEPNHGESTGAAGRPAARGGAARPRPIDPAARLAELEASIPRIERPGLRARDILGLLIAAGMMAAGWAWTFDLMWTRWFELWHREHLPLMERLTGGQSYYTHGPLVPLAALVIAFVIYRRVGFPAGRDLGPAPGGLSLPGRLRHWVGSHRGATTLGGVVLGFFLLVHVMSSPPANMIMVSSALAFIGTLLGLVMLWGGWPLLRAYWMPIVLLLFMVPMPMEQIARLNLHLKAIASDSALWLSVEGFGVPAVRQGSFVYLPNDPVTGEEKTLTVDNVCSGLRSLIALTFFAAMFALICRVRGLWRIVLLLLAVPVALLSNALRITGLIVVAHTDGIAAASEGGWFHDLSGLLIFVLALAILFAIEYLIILGARLTGRNWVDERLMGFITDRPPVKGARVRMFHTPALVALGLAAGAALYLSSQPQPPYTGHVASRAVPTEITIDGVRYGSTDHEVPELVRDILRTDDILFRIYDAPQRQVELMIVYSPNNRRGTHPPEVCLEGEGHRILTRGRQRIEAEGIGEMEVAELVTQRGQNWHYFCFVYKAGDGYTPSFMRQQMHLFLRSLLASNMSGALIRFSVPMEGRDVETARRRGLAAASALMPHIHRGLRLEPEDAPQPEPKP